MIYNNTEYQRRRCSDFFLNLNILGPHGSHFIGIDVATGRNIKFCEINFKVNEMQALHCLVLPRVAIMNTNEHHEVLWIVCTCF